MCRIACMKHGSSRNVSNAFFVFQEEFDDSVRGDNQHTE